MSDAVLTALAVSIGPTLVGFAALLQAKRNGRNLGTTNGKTIGDYAETTHAAILDHGIQLNKISTELSEHVAREDPALEALQAAVDVHIQVDDANFAHLFTHLKIPPTKETS